MPTLLFRTELPGLDLVSRGKVRDIYAAGENLVIVATDRLSAFDCVLPTPIPGKGQVLTQMTLFWLRHFGDLVPNHLISADVADFPAPFQAWRDELAGRSMFVRRAAMLPVECVARGYLSGSGWKDYQRSGVICGVRLPPNLPESGRLPESIFTPATKAQSGHDQNITLDDASRLIGKDTAKRVRDLTLKIYDRAAACALERGIIIADTKFEFGFIRNELILADEVLTPDSSRFWPRAGYRPGGPQPSFDKQFVRDYLESIQWNKRPPAPSLPDEIVSKTAEKYREAYRFLAGGEL